MPFGAPGSIKAKDADIQDQHIATAQGDGLAATPYVPLHADIGVGDPSDPIANDHTVNATLISFAKSLLLSLNFAGSQINGLFSSFGSITNQTPTDDNNDETFMARFKLILKRTPRLSQGNQIASNFTTQNINGTAVAGAALMQLIDAYSWAGYNQYLLIYDKSSTTSLASSTPIIAFLIPSVFGGSGNYGTLSIDRSHWGVSQFGEGHYMSSGITWALSSSPFNLVPVSSAECIVQIGYAPLASML